jgi:hypothetical protein
MFKKVKALLMPLMLAAALMAGLNQLGLAVAADAQYENHVTFQILPDESIVMQAQGSFTQDRYRWGFGDLVRGYQMSLDLETATEGSTDISFDLSVELSPEEASELANLELEVETQGDSAHQVVEVHVDYPGFIGLDGTLESNLDEPPFTGMIDLSMSATMYYVNYAREEIEQMLMMLPLMETMLAAQVAENSDGELSLSRLELVSSEMGTVSATFAIEASIARRGSRRRWPTWASCTPRRGTTLRRSPSLRWSPTPRAWSTSRRASPSRRAPRRRSWATSTSSST